VNLVVTRHHRTLVIVKSQHNQHCTSLDVIGANAISLARDRHQSHTKPAQCGFVHSAQQHENRHDELTQLISH